MALHHRYSHHLRRALAHATQLADEFGHPRQETAHLLVGVRLAEGSIGAQVLQDFDLPVAVARVYLKRLMVTQENRAGPIPQDATFDKALEQAADEATWLDHHYIGTEHLLLGITRTNLGNAMKLLRLLDITPDHLRRRLRHVIMDGKIEFSLEAVRSNARLSELSRRVLNAAEQESVSRDHHVIGLGHLLMALARERRGVTSPLLKQSGLDAHAVEQSLRNPHKSQLISIETVIAEAINQAEKLGSHYVGADHLLLALTTLPDGAQLIQQYGASSDRIQRLLRKHLS